MNVDINGSPILTTLPIFGGIPLTATLVVTWSIMLLLTLFCIWLTHDLRVDHVTTRQTVAEFLVNTAQNFVDSNMGTRFSHYAPFVAFLPRPIFPPSWPGQCWCLCSSPPPRSRPMALAATSRATPSPSRCSPRSISSARSRPPFRWRSVTSATSCPVPLSPPCCTGHWQV